VHKVPAGIDPGFDYNPGKAWKQGADALPVKASPLRPLKANAQDDVWRKAMQDFVESPTRSTSMTVGNLDKDMRDVLGTETPDVLLSADTMEKQLFRHPELKPETYLSLPELFDKPDAVIDYGDRRILLLRAGGKALAAVVKATKDSCTRHAPRACVPCCARGAWSKGMWIGPNKTGAPMGPTGTPHIAPTETVVLRRVD
jgi:hypothetical protein